MDIDAKTKDAADNAKTYAKVTGSVGATYTTETRDADGNRVIIVAVYEREPSA